MLAINWNEYNDSFEKIIIFKKYHNKGVEGLFNSPCVEGYGNTFKNGKLAYHLKYCELIHWNELSEDEKCNLMDILYKTSIHETIQDPE